MTRTASSFLGLLGLAGILLMGCSDQAPVSAPPAPAPKGTPLAPPSLEATSTVEASSWPIFRGDPQLRGRAPGRLGPKGELAWSFVTADAITASPVVADGVVYIGSNDGSVYAIGLSDGEKRWSFKTEDMIEAPALILDGRVYVGSNDGFFYALDAKSGELVWKRETRDKIMGGANWAVGADGRKRVVVGSYDASLYGFDAETGEPRFSYETGNYVNGTPAIADGMAVFGGCDAILHLVSVATGKVVREVPVGDECHVAGSVAIHEGRAYFGHYGAEFVAVDLATGAVDWAYRGRNQPFFSSPAIAGDRVVFGGRDRHLHCAALADGAPIWKFRTKRKVDGSPVVCGDKVVFGSADGRLYVLGLAKGEELFSYEIGQAILSSPAVVDGMVLIGANDGRLYAFRMAEG